MLPRWVLSILLLAPLIAAATPLQASVDSDDLQQAADELAAAREAVAQIESEHRSALRREAELKDLLAELIGTLDGVRRDRDEARRQATERIDEIYMRAGSTGGADLIFTGDLSEGWVRVVYAGAIVDLDREVIVTLEASERDLARLQQHLDATMAEQQRVADVLGGQANDAATLLADAEAEYRRVRAEWEWQEEQRRLAAIAATSSTTTTTPPAPTTTTTVPATTTAEPGSTTTTTPPAPTTTTTVPATTTTEPGSTTTTTPPEPVSGGTFPPPVERWRPLVAEYFPAGIVDDALSVMACESFGDPEAANSVSGAAGLFQHLPEYWPERAEAAGFPGASPYDPEANIAATWWLVEQSLGLGYDAWYFWTCKP